ncbi:MAG: TRAP transporter small permease [Tropicimonas sp.]|uniref:TRAP transporter small permease n=1 Tax=Tropicimonas sp. TaxID=2067044 RepID=UPI003A89745F
MAFIPPGFPALCGWLSRRAENFLALLQFSLFVTFLLQIVFRYFLYLPVGWTVEWVTIAWLWGILFGCAFVLRERDMIRLDILYASLPGQVRRGADILTGLIVAAIFAWTLPASWDYVGFMAVERTAYMQIPYNIVFSIYIPFACAVIVRSLLSVGAAISGGKTGARRDD